MRYLKIATWEKYQHYKDRDPPWIKLHQKILQSEDWVMLADASKLLMVVCMVVAARHQGKIPDSPEYIKKVACLDKLPDLKPLIECGFLVPLSDASMTLADASKVEQSASLETEKEKRREEPPVVPQGTKRGSQIPDDFQIDRAFGLKLGFTTEDLDFEEGKMRDHFKGTGGVKKDWQATGRVWLRKAWEMRPTWKKPAPSSQDPPDIEDNERHRQAVETQKLIKVNAERLRQERLAKYGTTEAVS